jgi:hypothetical protein
MIAVFNSYHDNTITDFGNISVNGRLLTQSQLWNGSSWTIPAGAVMSGGDISTESDSISLKIYHNTLSGIGNLINIEGPSDSFDLRDNVASYTGRYPNGPARFLYVGGRADHGGAATMKVEHNFIVTIGLEAIYIDSRNAWIVNDNEHESVGPPVPCTAAVRFPLCNLHSSSFDFEHAVSFDVQRNSANYHGYSAWDFYVGDEVSGSDFSFNEGLPSCTSAGCGGAQWQKSHPAQMQYLVRVGSGLGNSYSANESGNGPESTYARDGVPHEREDYPGIAAFRGANGASGMALGCSYPPSAGVNFCVPPEISEITIGRFLGMNLVDSSDHNRSTSLGFVPPTRFAPKGYALWHAAYAGSPKLPLVLNETADPRGALIVRGTPDADTARGLNKIHGTTAFPDGVQFPTLKANSGTRYLCIDSSGNVSSSVTPCSGT